MVAQSKPKRISRRLRINKSGRITLPADIRRSMGVKPGDYVDYIETADGQVYVVPANSSTGAQDPEIRSQSSNEGTYTKSPIQNE